MYHEERIIDGVLCWRGTPNGEWTAYDAVQLTEMLRGAKFQRDAGLCTFRSICTNR